MKLDVQKGGIDVAARSLSATDIESLQTNKSVKVTTGPGGEIRYIVFNFNTQPFGATTAEANPAKALAVRQAVADLIDRAAIAKQVYKDTYLQYNTDHYGASSTDEYALVKSQLEASKLFTVNLQSTEYVQYSKDRTADVYPEYQLGWFPDYSDADNYLTPFFLTKNFIGNHFSDPAIDSLLTAQAVETDKAKRTSEIGDIQDKVAAQLPTIPLLQGAQVVVEGKDVKGVTLDGSFKFRFGTLSK
jgi:peptide/nickel transport system substrate-binding protein